MINKNHNYLRIYIKKKEYVHRLREIVSDINATFILPALIQEHGPVIIIV